MDFYTGRSKHLNIRTGSISKNKFKDNVLFLNTKY